MTWTGRTRRRRTDRLDIMDPSRNLHILSVYVLEREYDTSRGDGVTAWKKHQVRHELSNGRLVKVLTIDTFEDLMDGTIYSRAEAQ